MGFLLHFSHLMLIPVTVMMKIMLVMMMMMAMMKAVRAVVYGYPHDENCPLTIFLLSGSIEGKIYLPEGKKTQGGSHASQMKAWECWEKARCSNLENYLP